MKKYIAAGGVAVVAFAFTASAASLDVSAAVLQVGQTADGELECADSARVTEWGYNDFDGTIENVEVVLTGNTCDGERIYVTPLEADGTWLNGATRATTVLVAGQDSYRIPFTGPLPAGADVEGVRIGIDAGY